jgi:hypothetical protein
MTYVPSAVCPLCGSKVVENTAAFSCAKWREGCRFTIWKNTLERQGGPLIDRKLFQSLMKEGRAHTPQGEITRNGAALSFAKAPQAGPPPPKIPTGPESQIIWEIEHEKDHPWKNAAYGNQKFLRRPTHPEADA